MSVSPVARPLPSPEFTIEVDSLAALAERLLRYVTRSFGARDAEDITQEALARGYETLPPADPDPWPWLVVVARHIAADLHRGRRLCESGTSLDQVEVAGDVDLEELAITGERCHLVRTALRRLPAGQRVVLVWHDIEQVPSASIAELLETNVNAVRQQLFKGRRRLLAEVAKAGSGLLGAAPALGTLATHLARTARDRTRRAACHLRGSAGDPALAGSVGSLAVALATVGLTLSVISAAAPTSVTLGGGGVRPATATTSRVADAQTVATTTVTSRIGRASPSPARRPASSTMPALDPIPLRPSVHHSVNPNPFAAGTVVSVDVSVVTPVGTVQQDDRIYNGAGARPVCQLGLPGVRCTS
ncbi:MAG: RNA polymerase sigma factor [Mycobacteriales bacterium]